MTLSQTQLRVLSQEMEKRRRTLRAELLRDAERVRAESYSEVAGSVTDLGDEALADLVTDLDNAELTRDLNELRALEAALNRLDDGAGFGLCAECGLEIPFERLKAEPAALRCFDCQSVHERTHAGTRTPTL